MGPAVQCTNDVELASKLFRGLGDRTRLTIIVELSGGERRVNDLVATLNGSQGNVSGHLKCLKDCGLVTDRPEGREVFYRLSHPEIIDVLNSVEALVGVTGTTIDLCSKYQSAP